MNIYFIFENVSRAHLFGYSNKVNKELQNTIGVNCSMNNKSGLNYTVGHTHTHTLTFKRKQVDV